MKELRIVSYNVQHFLNFYSRKITFDPFAETIREMNPDIIGLQEINGALDGSAEYRPQAMIMGEMLGYNYYFAEAIKFGGIKPYGVALLSKYPVISAENHHIPDPEPRKYNGYYETRTVLKARIDIGEEKPLLVLVSHFGLNPDEHELCSQSAISHIENERCVLMGDFNMRPDNPLICNIRARIHDTADELGENVLSFPSDKPVEKIDYIFTSPDITVRHADIPATVVSDHRPYICDVTV